jgi:hypothetical protein
MVTRALNVHSCAKWIAKQEAAARRLAREASIDRSPQPCHHKQASHVHGTHACYVLDACRCRECVTANTAYERARSRQHAYGRWNGYVDAQHAREHVEKLQAQGMGWKRIARAADVPTGTMWKLIYGVPSSGRPPSARIRPATEAAILAVRLNLAPGAIVPGIGTARRLQALVALGWSMSKLATLLDVTPANFGPIIHGTRNVQAATDRAVRDLYDELWNQQGPRDGHRDKIAYSRATRYAAAHQWAPPMAWDEGAIDDPDATPDTGSPARRSVHDLAEDVEWFLEDEPLATAQRVADRFQTSANTLQISLKRAERRDLLEQLARNARLSKEHVA